MSTSKHVSAEEKAIRYTHDSHGLSASNIADLFGRNRTTIAGYLRANTIDFKVIDSHEYKKVSGRVLRPVRRAAIREQSARVIKRPLKLEVEVRCM